MGLALRQQDPPLATRWRPSLGGYTESLAEFWQSLGGKGVFRPPGLKNFPPLPSSPCGEDFDELSELLPRSFGQLLGVEEVRVASQQPPSHRPLISLQRAGVAQTMPTIGASHEQPTLSLKL